MAEEPKEAGSGPTLTGKVFDSNSKDLEEWSIKFRSLVNAGDTKVGELLKAVEHESWEDELAKYKSHQIQPEFDEWDKGFIIESCAGMFNLLFIITTSEAGRSVEAVDVIVESSHARSGHQGDLGGVGATEPDTR